MRSTFPKLKLEGKKMGIEKHLELLGLPVKDKVTRFTGVVSNISFDLYGCIQALVTPQVDDKGDTQGSKWFDITRLNIISDTPVMDRPDFDRGYVSEGRKGAADKPIPSNA